MQEVHDSFKVYNVDQVLLLCNIAKMTSYSLCYLSFFIYVYFLDNTDGGNTEPYLYLWV